jgi:hypothetical protein
MREIISNPKMVAYCGLYCGACKRYLSDKCPGCHENKRAAWCKVRSCCIDNDYASCAECKEFTDPDDCKRFNNFMSKIFRLVFKSDRAACLNQIKALGMDGHAVKMTELQCQSLRKQ